MNAVIPFNGNAPMMTIPEVERVALAIAKGGLFGSNDPNAVLTLCLLAQAEGQHPAVVFRDYHIIKGKPAKKADAMLRDFVSAGGKVEWHKLDNDSADATFSHPGGGTVRIDWTMERARQAGLTTDMWRKYPRQMLRSRVISEGVRTVYPGATSGLYEVGEVQDITGDASPPVEHVIEPVNENRRPAPREKLDGPCTSKTALSREIGALRNRVNNSFDATDIDNLLSEADPIIQQAKEVWPALIDGEPEIEEDVGLRGDVKARKVYLREDGAGFAAMILELRQCADREALHAWRVANDTAVDQLDGMESRIFQREWDALENAFEGERLVDTLRAG